jgi:uncharacterized protein (DUF2132 family)
VFCYVVWQNIYNLIILCFHGDIIINIDNGITYNGRNQEFLTTILDMSLNELSRILCDRFGWNIFEIEVEITWRTLQTRASQACYVGVSISSDGSVNSTLRFVRMKEINMLDLYLNSRHRRGNSSSIELTWFSSNSQRTTQVSQIANSSRLGGNVSRQVLVRDIVKWNLC